MSTRIFYKDENSVILQGDMLTDEKIPENHIDLIVTSPPYNVNKDYGQANDNLSYEEYLDFTYKWLKKCLYWAKSDGRLCMNIPIDTGKGAGCPIFFLLSPEKVHIPFVHCINSSFVVSDLPRFAFFHSSLYITTTSSTGAIICGELALIKLPLALLFEILPSFHIIVVLYCQPTCFAI